MDHAIELDALSKKFGTRTAVDAVTLKVPHGSVYGLVGPNGAGKTTLMRTMLGFTRASSGNAKLLGHDMSNRPNTIYPRLGVIIEEPRFYPFMSGIDNLRQISAARAEHLTDADLERALESVGLASRAKDRVKGYSLGMRQRLGVARALLHDPELLILDEPSNGLDPPGIRDMRQLLRSLAEQGKTVFVSSHILAEIELLCDFVAMVKDGKIIANGTTKEITGNATNTTDSGTRETQYLVRVDNREAAAQKLNELPEITSVNLDELNQQLLVSTSKPHPDAAREIAKHLVENGIALDHLEQQSQTLEQRFLDLMKDDNNA